MLLSREVEPPLEVEPPSTSRERSTARLGPHPARARTLRRLPRPASTQRISSLSRRRPTTRTFTPFYFAREEHCKTWTAPRKSPDTTTTTTTGIHATDQLLVSTTPYYAHLYPLLLRARGALHDLDRTPQEPGRYDDYHDSLGSTGLRPIPPHYYRDPAHGPGVGSGLLPRVPPPTCSRPVSGVGLGPFVMRLLCCSLPAPARRQFFALRFATVCH